MAENKTNYEITAELVKSFIWPILLSILLFSNWSAIRGTISSLPEIVKGAESITIGELTIKTQNNSLASKADEESIQALDGISLEAILHLVGPAEAINLPSDWEVNSHFDSDTVNELIDRGLYIKEPAYSPPGGEPSENERVSRTKLGKKVARLLRGLLEELTA